MTEREREREENNIKRIYIRHKVASTGYISSLIPDFSFAIHQHREREPYSSRRARELEVVESH